jgi:hypothetical protein
LVTRAVTIVVPYEETPAGSYTLHTSSGLDGSRQSVWPVNGPVQAAGGSFSSEWATTVSGQVGLGESFWVTRDSDGVASTRSVMDAGPPTIFPPAEGALPFGWNFIGFEAWDGLTWYNPGTALTYGGILYVAIAPNYFAPCPWSPSYWMPVPMFGTGDVFTGSPTSLPFGWNFLGFEVWSDSASYAPGDALTYSSTLYVALEASHDVAPDADPAVWLPVPTFDNMGNCAAPRVVDWSAMPAAGGPAVAQSFENGAERGNLGLRISVTRWNHQLSILYPRSVFITILSVLMQFIQSSHGPIKTPF